MDQSNLYPAHQDCTRDETNSLRGFAILFVIANHFLNQYVDPHTFKGFANALMSIFFVLSGYGIANSLERRPKKAGTKMTPSLRFYIDRIPRIYPLLIISLLLDGWISNKAHSPLAYLGIKNHGIYLFVNQIIHCYLAALVLHSFLSKNSLKRFLLIMVSLFIVLNAAFLFTPLGKLHFVRYLLRSSLAYRDLFLLHLVLFSLGMVISKFQQNKNPVNGSRAIWSKAISILAILPVLFLLGKTTRVPLLRMGFDLLLLLSCVYICQLFIEHRLKVPYLNDLGVYSYSLYLFHLIYYALLEHLNVLQRDSTVSFLMVILLFPLFFLVCKTIEQGVGRLSYAGVHKLFPQ